VCYIEASGFYLGKLRGLLGDGNNEPYDDFRMPNGKIATSEAEFGHSFRLASSCAQPKTPAHAHAHGALPAACEEVFGKASPLRPLALVLDAEPFKQACSHAVAGDSANALRQACDIGSGYAALAVSGLLPAVMPAVCVQCTDADQPKKVGESYELKVPNKQADIIVAVETTVPNKKNYKDLVIPLVSQLVDALKSKHITDIKVYLVGITSKFPYPIVYDTDIKLKNPKVNFDDESRYNHIPTVTTGFEKFDSTEKYIIETINDLRITFGLTNMVAGYRSLMDLPLRPDAVQHTINVVGEQCKRACSIVEIVRTLAYAATFSTMPYSHTLVTVSPITKIGGGKSPAQVVGYTDDSVLLLGDKVASKGSDNLRDSLEKDEQDPCINFIEGTDGLVLAGANYHTLNPGQQKQFLQTAVSTITNKMLGSNLTRKCVCGYVDPFRVRSICVNEDKAAAGRRK
ncbi:apolipophorins-like, partial [Hyposmocoma kahamanoa]|uniref:apolipophorins-like n=1 Tax=Hyposmocoma kahamanoa TaxID=1477025 RepID=UPI000E6D61EB